MAAARKSGLAKSDYLPSKRAVVVGGLRRACVLSDRPADQGCLAKFHRVSDDRVEDVVFAVFAHLCQHLASEHGARVVERRQKTQNPEILVEL